MYRLNDIYYGRIFGRDLKTLNMTLNQVYDSQKNLIEQQLKWIKSINQKNAHKSFELFIQTDFRAKFEIQSSNRIQKLPLGKSILDLVDWCQ